MMHYCTAIMIEKIIMVGKSYFIVGNNNVGQAPHVESCIATPFSFLFFCYCFFDSVLLEPYASYIASLASETTVARCSTVQIPG